MADSFPSAGSGLVDVVAGVLAEHGPMTEEQLVSALAGRGVALGDDPDEALAEALDDGDGLVTVLADDRWASLPALLAGRVFTHRLTGPEVEHDMLDSNPDLDPGWSPVLVDLARFASDRGDVTRGLALLRRAGAPPDHPLAELLERFQAAPRSDVGRNDPCWCGSGSKYKKCHLHREGFPVPRKARRLTDEPADPDWIRVDDRWMFVVGHISGGVPFGCYSDEFENQP